MDLVTPVQRGIELLDGKAALDWRDTIDWAELDMRSHTMCVVGQLYGDFARGLEVLDLTRDDSRELGFMLPEGWLRQDAEQYGELTHSLADEWRRQVLTSVR